MHEIMHCLILETKSIAANLISQFEISNNDKFSQLFEYHSNPDLAYLVHFELKKQLMSDIDDIVKLSQEKCQVIQIIVLILLRHAPMDLFGQKYQDLVSKCLWKFSEPLLVHAAKLFWKEIPLLQGKQLKELIDPDPMDYFAQQGSNEELQKAQKYLYDQIQQMKNQNKVIKL